MTATNRMAFYSDDDGPVTEATGLSYGVEDRRFSSDRSENVSHDERFEYRWHPGQTFGHLHNIADNNDHYLPISFYTARTVIGGRFT